MTAAGLVRDLLSRETLLSSLFSSLFSSRFLVANDELFDLIKLPFSGDPFLGGDGVSLLLLVVLFLLEDYSSDSLLLLPI